MHICRLFNELTNVDAVSKCPDKGYLFGYLLLEQCVIDKQPSIKVILYLYRNFRNSISLTQLALFLVFHKMFPYFDLGYCSLSVHLEPIHFSSYPRHYVIRITWFRVFRTSLFMPECNTRLTGRMLLGRMCFVWVRLRTSHNYLVSQKL